MASSERKPDDSLKELVARVGTKFQFFQVVQLLHRLSPDAARVGELGPVQAEAIRFAHDPDLIFHASDIRQIRTKQNRSGAHYSEITTTFLGLVGSTSPLATHFAEEVVRAETSDDSSLRAFLDIFHHRLISLLYRAWKKHRLYAGFRSDGNDPFTRRALAMVGVDVLGAIPKHGLPPRELLALAPLFSVRARSARMLELVLRRILPDIEVSVESFTERRVVLEEPQRIALGKRNCTLGDSFTVGRAVLDRSGRFRVVLGPLGYDTYEMLMPGGRYHTTLRKVLEQFTRGTLEAELELRLSEDDSPHFELGNRRGSTLGMTTHLRAKGKHALRTRIVLSDDAHDAKPEPVID